MKKIVPSMVRKQLERVLAGPEFVTSKKLKQFLSYVVEQSLNGHPDKITQYAIAVEALGYGTNFDPNTIPNVRVLARRLRRALDQYYTRNSGRDPIRIDIPKGSYTPVFLDNPTVSKAHISSECPPPASEHTALDVTDPTIAVVMFEDLNAIDKNSYIARGLTTEILVSLTRFSELSVLGPLDQKPDKRIDFKKIGNEYGASFILRGWIRSLKENIRINAFLTDASNGTKLWAQTFDFDLDKTSLFEIEDQVTEQIVGVVADGLGIIFRKIRTDSYHKYIKVSEFSEAVLLYNNMWATLAPQDFSNALLAVNKVLEKQPANALMLALKSNIYYGDMLFDLNLNPESRSEMEALAQKACSLDPELQIARYNRVVQHGFHGRANKCIEEAKKVVDMNPNHARILAGCAIQVSSVEAYDLGWDLIERAKKLNPHYPGWYHFANYLVHLGNERYEEAWEEAQNIHIEGLYWHPIIRAAILGKIGRVKEAEVYIDEISQMKPEFSEHPKEYLKLLFVTDKHVEMIWDGLQKAGIRDV